MGTYGTSSYLVPSLGCTKRRRERGEKSTPPHHVIIIIFNGRWTDHEKDLLLPFVLDISSSDNHHHTLSNPTLPQQSSSRLLVERHTISFRQPIWLSDLLAPHLSESSRFYHPSHPPSSSQSSSIVTHPLSLLCRADRFHTAAPGRHRSI